MANLFIIIYSFFKKHRFLFIFFLLIVISSAVSFVFHLKLEEDITKAIPGKGLKDKMQLAFQNTNLADKIIVNICAADSTQELNSDSMIAFAEDLGNEFNSENYKPYLTDIFCQVNDSLFSQILTLFYENFPLFFDDNDFKQLDSLTTVENIGRSLQKSYESLISPASFAFKESIRRDPLGIVSIALRKLNSAQFDENYEIYNNYIFTKDHKHLLMFANTKHPASQTSANAVLAEMLGKTFEKLKAKHGNNIKAEGFGSSLIAVSNANRLKSDIILCFSIAAILLILIINFSVRDKRIFLIIFIPTLLGGGLALSALTLLEPALSVITLSMGSIILAITMDYSLHIISHQKHTRNIHATLKDVAFPIMVCGIATAFEFISLIFVSSAILRELGIFAAISILTSSALTLIILPQIIDKNRKTHIQEKNYLENFLDRVTRFNFDKNKPILIAFTIFTFVMIIYANRVGFEGDMMKMNYMSEDLKTAETNLKNINDFTKNTAYVISYGKNMEEALSNNEKAQLKVDSLKQKNIITKFRSVSSLLVSDSTQKERIRKWDQYWTKEKSDSLKNRVGVYASQIGFREGTFDAFFASLNNSYKPISEKIV